MATMCQNHPDVKATFIGTVLEPEVVAVAVCDECMPLFCAAVFEEMTGVDMSPALYLASEEGQANPDGPAQNGTVPRPVEEEPPGVSDVDPTAAEADRSGEHTTAEGAPTDEPPAPAPADTDLEAEDPRSGWDMLSGRTPNGSANHGTDTVPAANESPPDGMSMPLAGDS